MPPPEPAPLGPPWWQGAVAGLHDWGMQRLRARYPSLQHLHQDLVGEAVLQLTRLLSQPGEQWPASWFLADEPPDEDVRRFRGLAHTVLNRRVLDEFRRDVTGWVQSWDEVPEEEHPPSGAADHATALDQRRAVRALLLVVQGLSARDQALIERVGLGGEAPALSGAERERVRWLRQRLRTQLAQIMAAQESSANPPERAPSTSRGDDGSEP